MCLSCNIQMNNVRNMYDVSESCLRVNKRQTYFFGVESRVRQGDSLQLLLFNIVLDFGMRNFVLAWDGIEWGAGRKLKHLAYPENICSMADDFEDLSIRTQTVVYEKFKVGLRINKKKDCDNEVKARRYQLSCNKWRNTLGSR